MNSWSQEICALTLHIGFEHIKGKDNVLVDSLSRLRHLGLHDDNDPEDPGQEYRKSILKQTKTPYIVLIMIKIQMINLKLLDNSIFWTRKLLMTHIQVLILYQTHVI